jgi:hypothetical protein
LIVSSERIKAGSELFLDYTKYSNTLHSLLPSPHYSEFGLQQPQDQQEQRSSSSSKTIPIPKASDYAKADQVVKDLWEGYQAAITSTTASRITTSSSDNDDDMDIIITDAQWIGTYT